MTNSRLKPPYRVLKTENGRLVVNADNLLVHPEDIVAALNASPSAVAAEDLKMMQSPDLWPLWPLLPVKRWLEKSREYECAIIFASGKPEVIAADLYLLNDRPGNTYAEKFNGLTRMCYESFEALQAAGWRVD